MHRNSIKRTVIHLNETVYGSTCPMFNISCSCIDPSLVFANISTYPFMVRLFNYCFKCRIIPSAWQKEVINPIPKSGDKDIRLPLNYRGITLTCHMYKVYCTILNVRLFTFFRIKPDFSRGTKWVPLNEKLPGPYFHTGHNN